MFGMIKKYLTKKYINCLSDSRYILSRIEYFKMRYNIERIQDKKRYDDTMEKLAKYIYNIRDVYVQQQMIDSLNDAFYIGDTLCILTANYEVWSREKLFISKIIQEKILIKNDVYTSRFAIKKQYIFNKIIK
jgi:hypothetical protein